MAVVHTERGGVRFHLQPGPLESEALKLSLFDRDPGRESIREREREEIEKSRSLFRLERVSEAELAPSLSLTHEQDNFSLDLDLPSLKMNLR